VLFIVHALIVSIIVIVIFLIVIKHLYSATYSKILPLVYLYTLLRCQRSVYKYFSGARDAGEVFI